MLKSTRKLAGICLAPILLTACGGGGGSDDQTGTLNVSVTDAPVDGVAQVWVQFTAVELKPESGAPLNYEFDSPKTIDLKALTNGRIELLLDEEVPAGEYNWMKLDVNAELDGIYDSYVVDDQGGQIELRVPPDRLKLGNKFVVVAGGLSAFVIDWNLRMGLTNPVGQDGYKLQPSLRIIDQNDYGTIAGTVDTNLLPPIDASCTSDANTGEGNVVYVYAGSNIAPDDADGNAPDPLSTADVSLNLESGQQEYMATFLAPGDYTVAFTCQGGDDVMPDSENPGADTNDALTFTAGINASVQADATTTVNFGAP